ncbi:MAG: hypothetical protein H0X37_17700 [Herpetosiphonaceae bacterium]|nr:hypothetical protein [Herpetosiphonaceae bacterium]
MSVSAPPRRPISLLSAVGVLVRAQLLIARNTFWRGKIGRKLLLVGAVALIAFAAYGINRLMHALVGGLTSPGFVSALQRAARANPGAGIPVDLKPFLTTVPSIIFFGTLLLLVLTSFSTVLSSLYLAGDIDMLVVAPVPMRAVFVVKFFGGLLLPYLLLFGLLGPALLGFGQGLGYGAAFFVTALLALLLFPLLPIGIGTLLVILVVRVIPARRAREMVAVIGGLVGLAWYVLSQFTREFSRRVANVQTLNSLRRLDSPLLPSAWASRALLAAGQHDWPTLLMYGGLFAIVSLAIFGGCLLLAERLYYIGWSNMAVQGGHAHRHKRAEQSEAVHASLFDQLFAFLPQQSRAVLAKDLRVFPRDLRNLQRLIFPLVIAIIWSIRLISSAPASRNLGFGAGIFDSLAGAGISFYICMTMAGALGGAGISREGKGFWLLQVAPISAFRLLLGKLALTYLPFPLIGTLFLAVFTVLRHSSVLVFAESLLLILVVGLGTSSLTLGINAAFPRLNWDNPQRQTSWRAGVLTMVCYLVYLGIALGVAVGLPLLGQIMPRYAVAFTIGGWLLLLGVTAFTVWAALAFGSARVSEMEVA